MKGSLGKRKLFPIWNHDFYAAVLNLGELHSHEFNNRHCKHEALDCFFEIGVLWCLFHFISCKLEFLANTDRAAVSINQLRPREQPNGTVRGEGVDFLVGMAELQQNFPAVFAKMGGVDHGVTVAGWR